MVLLARVKGNCVDPSYILTKHKHWQAVFVGILMHMNWVWFLLDNLCISFHAVFNLMLLQ